ncbi:MAG: DMT family transporter [Sporocytophaga sp.]|uniref:DMT family transporter n=1 Tax=Sporocytophaga sp. TaxID=2231183 RepID=UPI001B182F23|nr:DMT family transporter [Sporocytophaga sp.]MBO9702824.1 DMT family transporter [Sporocytophaga sp.]
MEQSENLVAKSGKFSAYLAAIVVVFIWSGWITLSRMGVHTNLTPYDITLLRFGTAAILTLPFSLRYDWKSVKWHQIMLVALGCGFPYTMLSFIGLKTTKAANAGVLVNGMLPVIGLLFTILWFKERVSKMKYLAIFVLLTANLLMANLASSFSASYLPGILCLLSAALVFSTYMAATRRWGYGMKDVIAFVPLVNAVLFFPLWLMNPSAILSSPAQDVLIQMIYQGVVVSVFALLLITFSVSKLGSGPMSVFLSYVPVVTAVLAFFFLKESLSYTEQAGIVLCSAGLMIYAKS